MKVELTEIISKKLLVFAVGTKRIQYCFWSFYECL